MLLEVQINSSFVEHNPMLRSTASGRVIMFTPPIDADYWLWRVPLNDSQAVVAFPKFRTIGIGFQVEKDDWNTNLPYTLPAADIFKHIQRNKGDDTISDADCIQAIELLQQAITASGKFD